jgi:hypothetical protein
MQTCETPTQVEAGASVPVQASRPNSPEDNPATHRVKPDLIETTARWATRLRHGPGWAVVLGCDWGHSGSAAELQEAIASVKAELAGHPASRRAFTAGFIEGRWQVLA